MRKLRLIRPWRLQTRRQKTDFEYLDIINNTAVLISCRGPQDNDYQLERTGSPRAATPTALTVNAPLDLSFTGKKVKGPHA